MIKRNIKTYIPRKDRGGKEFETYTKDSFRYDALRDVYICPNGCTLKYSTFRQDKGAKRYNSSATDCKNCTFRSNCISEKVRVKSIERSYHWSEYKKQHENDSTSYYREAQKLRKVRCEGTFSHQKARHCLRRAKMRGIVQTAGQCLLSACVVNLKRMIKWMKDTPGITRHSAAPCIFARLRAFFMPFCQQGQVRPPQIVDWFSVLVLLNYILFFMGFQ